MAALTGWYVRRSKYSHGATRTSERAELPAAVQAVGRIADCRQRDLDIDTYIVISDPEYVLNEITNWIYKRK